MADHPEITLADLPALLSFISPDDRNTWVEVAMGVKAEFGEAAFPDWDSWSQGSDSYKAADAKAVWRSCKGGKIGIGTVIHYAKQGGWKPARRVMSAAERRHMQAEAAARRAKRQAELEADEKRKAAMQAQVQAATLELLAKHTAARGKSRYLENRRVGAFGVRFLQRTVVLSVDDKRERCDLWLGDGVRLFFESLPRPRPDHISFRKYSAGDILIPLADLDGQIWSHQSINGNGTKLFPKYGRKQGLCHWIGRQEDMGVIALAEGYATAASVFEATGWPVVVCIDVGNMAHIGRALRERHPASRLIIAGDDDPKPDGSNPGRRQAEALALELGATAVFPRLPEQAQEVA